MANTTYSNTDLDLVPTHGGSVRVTIASNAGQGNDGTSLPCKKVWLISDALDVRVRLSSACTAITGIPVPAFLAGSYMQPLEIEIDDVSKLYFYGATNAKIVDVLYRC